MIASLNASQTRSSQRAAQTGGLTKEPPGGSGLSRFVSISIYALFHIVLRPHTQN